MYHPLGTIPKSNVKIVDRDKIDTTKTQIHDRSLSWLIIALSPCIDILQLKIQHPYIEVEFTIQSCIWRLKYFNPIPTARLYYTCIGSDRHVITTIFYDNELAVPQSLEIYWCMGDQEKSNNANIESRDKTKYIKYLARNRQQIQHLNTWN